MSLTGREENEFISVFTPNIEHFMAHTGEIVRTLNCLQLTKWCLKNEKLINEAYHPELW
jgi:hypothetical protein